jgi:uncharacterized protein (TIGR01777 family)
MRTSFTKESFLSASRERVFSFHERPDAFPILTPAEQKIEVQSTVSTIRPSDERVRFSVPFLFLKFRFEMAHTLYDPPGLFVDEQKKGLFSSWRHEHRFLEGGDANHPACLLRDHIELAHPFLFIFAPFVRHRLQQLFEYRHRTTREAVMSRERDGSAARGKRLVLTGATGLIGRRVTEILLEQGAEVVALTRDPERAGRLLGDDVTPLFWDFERLEQGNWRRAMEGAHGVIHLAGTPLFERRWNSAFKRRMEESRVQGTRQLVEAVRRAEKRPGVFVSASAVGIYGTDPDRACDEEAGPGDDLLANICVNWEKEAVRLSSEGVRTALIRVGIVLSRESGALKELLPIYRWGLGGTMGSPRPTVNWIHLEDAARIFVMAALDPKMSGPYNATAPQPVSNRAFGRTLARVVKRPAPFVYPVSFLRLVIGEAAEYASGGPRVVSGKIEEAGYRFFFRDLEPALRNALRD